MAAEQMKKVASHLTCPVCYELYKKPKYLPCYHSYCEECLVKLQKDSSDSNTCPECRKNYVTDNIVVGYAVELYDGEHPSSILTRALTQR